MKKLVFYYFFLLFSLLSIFSSGVVDSQDGFQYLAVARNIYYQGKPTSPPYEYNTRKNIHMPSVVGRDGESYSFTGLGFSLALVPAVALTDIIYRIYQVSPPTHFPLENDWLILLTASFTNAFFGALLGTTLFLYLIQLKIPKKQALFLSFISIFATNLFVYSKHILAHMMFISFLTLSFYLLKTYADRLDKKLLLLSATSFGITMITYNSTFLLTVPVYILYYLLLLKPTITISFIKRFRADILTFLIGFLPLLLTYIWFENLRSFSGSSLGFASPVFLGDYAQNRLLKVPFTVIFEGIYGQLFSPGRSLFLYTPLLLLIFIFWFKIKSRTKPELLVFLLLSAIYILFYGAQYSIGKIDQGIASLWHGESSWGPRYLTPLIPFGMLIVSSIYCQLKKIHKLFIFLPLVLIGFYIEILGVLMPYQIKYHDLETRRFTINGTEYPMYSYINIFPRYSPILLMSKKLFKLTSSFPLTLDHGSYNVRFYDGIDFPFNVGPERWRVIEDTGYISFDNNERDPVIKISLGLINHPLSEEASQSAEINFSLNGFSLSQKSHSLKVGEREVVDLSIDPKHLKIKDNQLISKITFSDPSVTANHSQIISFNSFFINEKPVNLESINFPYVSTLGPKMTNINYETYGGLNKDHWRYWELHTQMFERLPDFWWVRNLYYWDIPQTLIKSLFILNLSLVLIFGYLVIKQLWKR